MSTPTNIPETPMGETKQDSFFGSKEKFHQQLQDIFQTILRLTGSGHFDQLCQWMEYKQYYTIDDFFENSYHDLENFDNKGPATEYKWKGRVNHLSPIVAQKLKCFIKWMTHEERPYVTRFYQCLRLCSCGTKPQRSENHHFVMTSSWEPQCHRDIIMRTPRITGKPKFSCSGGL